MNTKAKTKVTPKKLIKPPPQITERNRTTFCIPIAMLDSMYAAMDIEGVSRKRRSKWIEQAVNHLFEIPGYGELILEEFIDSGRNKMIPVSLSLHVKNQIDNLLVKLNQQAEKPVEISALLRTAISQYLVRKVPTMGNNFYRKL